MFYTIGAIVVAVVSVILCIVICMQEAKQSGLGAGIAGGSDTYWSKNKSRSKEGKLVRITVIAAIAFFVIAILLNVKAFVNPDEVAAETTAAEAVTEAAEAEEDADVEAVTDAVEEITGAAESETQADAGAETESE